jgi:hypothetical protein
MATAICEFMWLVTSLQSTFRWNPLLVAPAVLLVAPAILLVAPAVLLVAPAILLPANQLV